MFRLVDSGWHQILDQALKADFTRAWIVSPFIKERAAKRLLQYGKPTDLKIITRFDLDGFLACVSDISALRLILKAGAQIRGIKNLHAKVYLLGQNHAIVSSANLTEQGLLRNHEFGFEAQDPGIISSCNQYFESLWARAGANLTMTTLDSWEKRVASSWASGAGTRMTNVLGDEGTNIGLPSYPVFQTDSPWNADQGFVKFFGEGTNRVEHSFSVFEEIERAGCHWACNFPSSKRPRMVRDGAVMFMGPARKTK